MVKKWKIVVAIVAVFVAVLGAVFLFLPQKPKEIGSTTTIGEQVNFSVDSVLSYGEGCIGAAGKEYSRTSVDSGEISEIEAILSKVEITPIDQPRDSYSYYLKIELANSGGMLTFHKDNRVEIGDIVYRTKQPLTETLQKLEEIYKRE